MLGKDQAVERMACTLAQKSSGADGAPFERSRKLPFAYLVTEVSYPVFQSLFSHL